MAERDSTRLLIDQQMPDERVTTVLCDLDGVIWLAHQPIAGAVDAIARLRSAGCRVVFVTNNSASIVAEHEAALAAIGIDAVDDVISSSMAAAQLVDRGERVLVSGGPGVIEAVERRGAVAVRNDGSGSLRSEGFDAVMVGLHRDFDYDRLAVAAAALHGGARLIGTNSDSTYPTPSGLEPGGGSILAAVATAGDAIPVIAGKPHPPMADAIAAHLSASGGGFDPERTIMVGDRPETDGLMAARIGCRFALVRSGVNAIGAALEHHGDVTIHFDVADLAALTDSILS